MFNTYAKGRITVKFAGICLNLCPNRHEYEIALCKAAESGR